MDPAPAAAPERPRTRARVRTTHLAPAALRVACDHALFEFLAPWMRNGCALYAANKEIQRGAVLYRRRRLGKLAALRREVLRLRDDDCFVNLSVPSPALDGRVGMHAWHKILDVRGDTVILECLFKSGGAPDRFATAFVRLEQWRYSVSAVARPGARIERATYTHRGLLDCWNMGVRMYADEEDEHEDY